MQWCGTDWLPPWPLPKLSGELLNDFHPTEAAALGNWICRFKHATWSSISWDGKLWTMTSWLWHWHSGVAIFSRMWFWLWLGISIRTRTGRTVRLWVWVGGITATYHHISQGPVEVVNTPWRDCHQCQCPRPPEFWHPRWESQRGAQKDFMQLWSGAYLALPGPSFLIWAWSWGLLSLARWKRTMQGCAVWVGSGKVYCTLMAGQGWQEVKLMAGLGCTVLLHCTGYRKLRSGMQHCNRCSTVACICMWNMFMHVIVVLWSFWTSSAWNVIKVGSGRIVDCTCRGKRKSILISILL